MNHSFQRKMKFYRKASTFSKFAAAAEFLILAERKRKKAEVSFFRDSRGRHIPRRGGSEANMGGFKVFKIAFHDFFSALKCFTHLTLW